MTAGEIDFAEFVRMTGPAWNRWAARLDSPGWEDARQELLIAAWIAVEDFEPGRISEPWRYVAFTARHRAHRRIWRARNRRGLELAAAREAIPPRDGSEDARRAHAALELSELLARCGGNERRAFAQAAADYGVRAPEYSPERGPAPRTRLKGALGRLRNVSRRTKMNIEKVDLKHMQSVTKELKLDVGDAKTAKDFALTLTAHFSKLNDSALLVCEDCGGLSPENLPKCAFCGAEDEIVEGKPPAPKSSSSVARERAPAWKDRVVRAKEKDQKEEKPALAKTNGVSGTNGSNGVHVGTLVPSEGAKQYPNAPKTLDEAVKGIEQIKGQQAATCWDLGRFVYENVYEKKLWMTRLGENGKPAYKSFAAWVREESGLSESYVFGSMEVFRTFSREEAALVGSKHLHVLVAAPKEDRKALLHAAKEEGLTVKETKALVDDRRKAKGVKVQNNRGKEMPKGGRPVERIALTLAPGLFKAPLLKKGTDKPAKRLADSPTIRIEGQNGVVLTLLIHENAKGELVASGTPKHEG